MINESTIENACMDWFAQLRYAKHTAEKGAVYKTFDRDALRSAMVRLNSDFSDADIDDALQQVLDLSDVPDLLARNRTAHKYLVSGVKITRTIDGDDAGDSVRLIDFDNPENNEFSIVSQLSIQGTFEKRRPDLVVYVNGLPLSVIELKNPADENATLEKAYNQIETYKAQIDDLFTFNLVNVISDGRDTGVGSLTANFSRYSAWRTGDEGTQEDWELNTLANGLFRPDLLLDYLRYFVVFEEETPGKIIKKTAGYHQFYGVRRAVASSVRARTENTGKCGVFWHTQGSGKSISMVYFVAKLRSHPAMNNPTFVVITDRQDLDRQLYQTFELSPQLVGHVEQADSRAAVRDYLNSRLSGGVLFTTIQKFGLQAGEDTFPTLNTRDNIVVLADEAHRSQYGHNMKLKEDKGTFEYGYSQHMRDALPNANFIGFTGTPIEIHDKSTQSVFGDYVDIYDINDAVADGATVEIFYQADLVKLSTSEKLPEISQLVDDTLDNEATEEKEKTKSQWSSVAAVAGASERVATIAEKITNHFAERQLELSGKAMCVTMSRQNCVALYDAIINIHPEWHHPDVDKGAVKIVMTSSADDSDSLKEHKYTSRSLQTIEDRFKDPDDPLKIVIVRDMWLTGFDVPCANTLYVDKPMQGHNLMQAIARVNRVFGDKPSGLVVDYIGIATSLQEATKTYTASKGKGTPAIDLEQAIGICIDQIDICRERLKNVDYRDAFASNPMETMPKVVDYLLDPDRQEDKRSFCDAVVALIKAYTLCGTDGRIKEHAKEIAFYRAVKAVISKGNKSQSLTDAEKEAIMRKLLGDAITVKGNGDILSLGKLSGINGDEHISILDEKFLMQVADMTEQNIAAELLRQLLNNEIKAKFKTDIVLEKKFSERLMDTINKMNEQAISTAEAIKQLIEISKELIQAEKRGEELGLSPEEMAFYNAICQNESAVKNMEELILIKLAREIRSDLAKLITVDWDKRDNVLSRIRIKIKRLLKKYKYPPDGVPEAVELVLEQAMVVGKSWDV